MGYDEELLNEERLEAVRASGVAATYELAVIEAPARITFAAKWTVEWDGISATLYKEDETRTFGRVSKVVQVEYPHHHHFHTAVVILRFSQRRGWSVIAVIDSEIYGIA